MMYIDFVFQYPPCFRCRKIECACPNNILIKHQIGNWCSFIHLFKEVVKHRYKLCLICEDDLKFTDDYKEILMPLLNEDNFKKHNFDYTKPLLIRLSCRYGPLHDDKGAPRFTQDITWSNSCFAINFQMAQSILDNLKKIEHTSDVYFHRDVLKLDNTIQHFTVVPPPAFDISSGRYPESYQEKFYSEIHPKRIDDFDIKRDDEHIKRIEYKKLLCLSHPGSGAKYAIDFFNKLGLNIGLENMEKDGLANWMLAVNAKRYPWGNVTNRSRYYFANTIHVIKNPFAAIPGIILDNHRTMNKRSYQFKREHIQKELNIALPETEKDQVSPLVTAVQSFIYWNKIIENKKPDFVFRVDHDQENMANFLRDKKLIPEAGMSRNAYHETLEKHPKQTISENEYKALPPNLIEELILFCEKYNYYHFFKEDYIRSVKVNKYNFSMNVNSKQYKCIIRCLIVKRNMNNTQKVNPV